MFTSLEMPDRVIRNSAFSKIVRERKSRCVEFAIQLPGNPDAPDVFTWFWKSEDNTYQVGVGKYGKEYRWQQSHWKDGGYGNNPNDMMPSIMKNGELLDFDGSFDHVFRFIQWASQKSLEATRVLGSLFYRNAKMVDHQETPDGNLSYLPPRDVIDYLQSTLGDFEGISVEAYLHYLDAIALNEDVKYSTLGYDIATGTGRENNMLTYAHLAAILIGEGSLAKLCSQFSRPPVGVSPIPQNVAIVAFPDLKIR